MKIWWRNVYNNVIYIDDELLYWFNNKYEVLSYKDYYNGYADCLIEQIWAMREGLT